MFFESTKHIAEELSDQHIAPNKRLVHLRTYQTSRLKTYPKLFPVIFTAENQ